MSYSSLVKIPPKTAMNGGLSSTGNSLASIFGRPGSLTQNCSPITNEILAAYIVTRDVGPFRVSGFRPAVESLERIFNKVETKEPTLFKDARTAGMTCCRAIRGSTRSYSIHSWGGAIDLYFGKGIVPLGSTFTNQGILDLYPYFHEEGWYWGAEFSRNDGMHMEVARQTIERWKDDKFKTQHAQTVQKVLAANLLVLNGYPIPEAVLKEGHWWAPANQVARSLEHELPSVQMVKVREAIPALRYKIVKTNDLRIDKNRFYITAYPYTQGAQ